MDIKSFIISYDMETYKISLSSNFGKKRLFLATKNQRSLLSLFFLNTNDAVKLTKNIFNVNK